MAEPEESGTAETPEHESDSSGGSKSKGGNGGVNSSGGDSESTEASRGEENQGTVQPDVESLRLSPTVNSVISQFQEADSISSVALVDAILDRGHRQKYAGGRASGLSLTESDIDDRRPVGTWLVRVRALFDPTQAELLHGRLIILGLSLLDPQLREQLQQNGFLPALEEEIREPIDDILTLEGWRLWVPAEGAPDQPDDPLEAIEKDQLGRVSFADYLARRLNAVPESNSYSIHLDGPWGAGKSTVLNFVDVKLRHGLGLSGSLHEALDQFTDTQRISAATLVEAILNEGDPPRREEYADGRGSDLFTDAHDSKQHPVVTWVGDARARVDPNRCGRRPLEAWLKDVRTLFDDEHDLDGRLVIIGLAWLDPQLRKRMAKNDFLSALEAEVSRPSLDDRLTDEGRSAYESAQARSIDASMDGGWDVDQAGATASATAQSSTWTERSEPTDDPWLVVRFNAWQHQHIQPPWWPLMEQVFNQSKARLRFRDWLDEYWWRFSMGRVPSIIGIIVVVLLVAIAVSAVLNTIPPDTPVLSYLEENAEAISAVLALGGAVWAGVHIASKPFFLRSAAAAQSYVEFTSDPMNEIKNRFNTLIDRIPARVAVFIDDLDRCESSYVVELLEGIQTLFNDAPVVFVVAADRRWLTTCFEQEFDGQKPFVHEPGKPLGTLFLEKVFQVSTPLPGISDDLKREFWQNLILVQPDDAADNIEEELPAARERISETRTEGEIRRIVAKSNNLPFWQRRVIREEAVKQYASTEIYERSEHLLKPFASLLEPNPRAMKRLVNAYNVNRVLMTLAGVEIERDQLALWTLLTLNWPQLATYLRDNPWMTQQIKQADDTGVSEEVKALFTDPDVIAVVTGKPVTAELAPDIVEDCAIIRA